MSNKNVCKKSLTSIEFFGSIISSQVVSYWPIKNLKFLFNLIFIKKDKNTFLKKKNDHEINEYHRNNCILEINLLFGESKCKIVCLHLSV
jgi:hypothetical protein